MHHLGDTYSNLPVDTSSRACYVDRGVANAFDYDPRFGTSLMAPDAGSAEGGVPSASLKATQSGAQEPRESAAARVLEVEDEDVDSV